MKKYTMLGVNTATLSCCLLECLIQFDNLDVDNLESSDFNHYATNWNGCDSIPRTLSLKNFKQTGNKILLKHPISFTGSDLDMGHSYDWTFTIQEIRELERT